MARLAKAVTVLNYCNINMNGLIKNFTDTILKKLIIKLQVKN